MKAVDRPFTQIINGTTQFVIPVFQRDYRWTETQCEQLWHDILSAGKESQSSGKHFLGSLVYISTSDSSAGFTKWLLIDGQQRMTSLFLLLAALRDHIQKTGWAGGVDDPTARKIDGNFLKNLLEEGDRQHKLVLRRHDHETLVSILDGSELSPEPSERLLENYEYFGAKLEDVDVAVVYRGIGRLVLVDVTLDRAMDDPQMIFESLNSTGIDLSQADLIRNFILMKLDESDQTKLYEQYWAKIESLFKGSEKTFDSFARDFLALKTQASKQEKADEVYRAFRRFFTVFETQTGGLEAALAELLRFARYYAAFSTGEVSPEFAESFGRLRRLADVPAILVMRLFDCHDRLGTMTPQSFNEAIDLLESYIFRRAICGHQTRGYWQVFANLAYKIKDGEPLQSLKVGLARLSESIRFPLDDEFEQNLQNRDLYGLRVCSHLLDRLENHNNKEPTDTSGFSIEHILPQNEKLKPEWQQMLGENWSEIHRQWIHRLGNLTLTGYNSTYSDRPFETKKTTPGGFSDSSVRLNRYVREQPTWTDIEMGERSRILTDQSLDVWPPLVIDQELVEAERLSDMRDLAARRDVNRVNMSSGARKLFETLQYSVKEIDKDVLELAETKSISYHGPDFFLEVLPRKSNLTLLLPLDFNETVDPNGVAEDATQWKFFANARHEGGVTIYIREPEDVDRALPVIRQAYKLTSI